MSQALAKSRENSTGYRQYLLASYYLAAGNLSVTTIAVGVFLIALGGTIVAGFHAVFGAMFGIWGATLVLVGVLAYAVLLGNRVWARASE